MVSVYIVNYASIGNASSSYSNLVEFGVNALSNTLVLLTINQLGDTRRLLGFDDGSPLYIIKLSLLYFTVQTVTNLYVKRYLNMY